MVTMENLHVQSVVHACKEWLTCFAKVKIYEIYKESNKVADWLATKAFDHQFF